MKCSIAVSSREACLRIVMRGMVRKKRSFVFSFEGIESLELGKGGIGRSNSGHGGLDYCPNKKMCGICSCLVSKEVLSGNEYAGGGRLGIAFYLLSWNLCRRTSQDSEEGRDLRGRPEIL